MNQVLFTWQNPDTQEDVKFSVRAQSALEANMFSVDFILHAKRIAPLYGIPIEDGYQWNTFPPSLDIMVQKFIRYMQSTTIEGNVPFPKHIFQVTKGEEFKAWYDFITSHDDLFKEWENAYQDANKKQADPN